MGRPRTIPAPGKKARYMIRNELEESVHFQKEEITALAQEAEEIYNKLVQLGAPPSELFEQLILFLRQEDYVWNHPDVDEKCVCPGCKRK